jgi:hypothetical protein
VPHAHPSVLYLIDPTVAQRLATITAARLGKGDDSGFLATAGVSPLILHLAVAYDSH